MNPTDKVDDLLAKAGAQWRAGQPSAPEPDLDRITGSTDRHRRRRWLVPTLAAASVAAIAVAALTVLPDTKEPAVAPPVSSPTLQTAEGGVPSGKPSAEELLVRNGDKVVVDGQVIAAPGKDPVFCPPVARHAIGYPPGKEPAPNCPEEISVKLIGVDLGKLSEPKLTKGVRSGFAHLVGRWQDRTLTVEEQSAPHKVQTPAEPLRCPTPSGGWPSRPSNIQSQPVRNFLEANRAVIASLRSAYPNGYSRNAPVVIAIGVAQGDPAAFRKTFEKVYQGNLCVFAGRLSQADSERIAGAISDLLPNRRDLAIQLVGGSGDDGLVQVGMLVFDEKAKTAFTPFGLQNLILDVAVKPVR
ncbi:hypothetical protein [Kribbella sp. CA-293567]|uniref:hypothetical protein n=1 Tax=Kribbella sp. CA-293567 TaxID=3002436 RepID=UPI0022DE0B29|nr:hypothetical protein [Kribbella sp. CA-293567]WBQ07044.1 hypothetical protein OX958_09635 [Kribbella sp. CA-293567]